MKISAILPPNPEGYQINPADHAQDVVYQLLANIIQLATTIAGGIAVIMIIWGAFQYFTAYGNEEKANKAKTTITWAIVGLVVMILAKIIVREIWGLVTTGEPKFWF